MCQVGCSLPSAFPDRLSSVRNFCLNMLRCCQVLEDVIQWAVKTARAMEFDRLSWPESALECAQHVLDLMKVGAEFDIKLGFFQQYSAPGSCLHQLIGLIKAFKQMKTLKNVYFIRIPLNDFMDENKATVAATLLDNVSLIKVSLINN